MNEEEPQEEHSCDANAIYYEHLCELESFMYKLSKILEFEQHNRGCWYTDYQLKEDLPKEKKDDN